MSENLGNQKQPLENVVSFSLPKDYFFEKGMKAFQKNETDQAVYYLKRAAEDEENPTVLVEIARKLLALNQYQMGITILEYTLDKQPANEDVYYLLAYAFFELGLFQKANIYAQKYMDIGTDEEQLEELEDYLDVIQSEEDDDLSINDELLVLQERVTNYLANHDWKSAKTTLLTIVDRYQDFWPAYNNLALVELHLGNHDEAIRVLYYVLEHNPGNLSALIHLTMLRRLIGQEKEAFEQLVSFENIVPISEEHRHKLGVLFYQFQQYEQAFRLFHLLYLERPQRELQFYYMYCDSAYRCGRQDYAEKVWNYEIGNSDEDGEQYPWSEKKHTTSEIEDLMTDTEFQSQFAKTNSERWGLIYFMKEYYYLQKFISVLEDLPELDLIGIDADLEQVLLQNVCYMEPHPSIQIVLNGAKTIQNIWDEEYVNLRDHLQIWFYSVCELTVKYNELPIDEKVLLAATHYLTAKKEQNVSQKEIAAHYKISTYLLKKGIDYIKNIF